MEVLEVAYKRTQVDFSGAGKAITKYEIDGFPIKSGDIRKYYEYVLALDLKRKRKEYADFIRGISPIIFDLFTMILRHEFNVSIEDYTVNTNKR